MTRAVGAGGSLPPSPTAGIPAMSPLLLALLACQPDAPEPAASEPAAAARAVPEPVPGPHATDDEKARLQRYHADCSAGQARGCAALGQVHRDGAWVARDLEVARAMYARACDLGSRCSTLGVLLYQGTGGPVDEDRALALWQRDCAAGVAEGCAQEGVAHQRGIGTGVDLGRARARFAQACAADHAPACTNLGYLLQGGEGGAEDMDGARSAYDKACRLGDDTGCNNLGLIAPPLDAPILLSPSEGSVQTRAPLPVGLALPAAFAGAAATLRLDGGLVVDPGLITRAGRTPRGPGAMLLATLRDVPPGPHTLDIALQTATGETLAVQSSFTMQPPPCAVPLFAVDGAGLPTAARVVVEDRGGAVDLSPSDAAALDTMGRDSALHSVLLPAGSATLHTAPGWHRLTAVRSLREDTAVWEGALCAGPDQPAITLRLPTVVETQGALLADLHVHTANSGDAFVPHGLRADSLRAAGLEAVVITDHDRATDPAPLGLPGAMPGAEVTLQGAAHRASGGHLNVFPLRPGTPLPAAGLPDTRAVVGLAPPGGVVQLNHPRGIQFRPDNPARPAAHALFTHVDFDRARPLGEQPILELLQGIGALEVVNRFSWSRYREVRADWFVLLSAGRRITGTGNSDSHGLALEQAGFPVNLVQARTPAEVPAAVQAGRVGVSTGPVVELVVRDGDSTAAPGDTFVARQGWADVEIRVRAAPWVPVHEVRLVHDGEVVHRAPIPGGSGVSRARVMLRRDVTQDGWLLAEAGWPIDDDAATSPAVPGIYGRVAPGYVPLGFTNPVWLEAPGPPPGG